MKNASDHHVALVLVFMDEDYLQSVPLLVGVFLLMDLSIGLRCSVLWCWVRLVANTKESLNPTWTKFHLWNYIGPTKTFLSSGGKNHRRMCTTMKITHLGFHKLCDNNLLLILQYVAQNNVTTYIQSTRLFRILLIGINFDCLCKTIWGLHVIMFPLIYRVFLTLKFYRILWKGLHS